MARSLCTGQRAASNGRPHCGQARLPPLRRPRSRAAAISARASSPTTTAMSTTGDWSGKIIAILVYRNLPAADRPLPRLQLFLALQPIHRLGIIGGAIVVNEDFLALPDILDR